jgi:hypothetical protein
MSAIEKSRMDMNTDAAMARASIRFDVAQMVAAIDKRLTLLEKDR